MVEWCNKVLLLVPSFFPPILRSFDFNPYFLSATEYIKKNIPLPMCPLPFPYSQRQLKPGENWERERERKHKEKYHRPGWFISNSATRKDVMTQKHLDLYSNWWRALFMFRHLLSIWIKQSKHRNENWILLYAWCNSVIFVNSISASFILTVFQPNSFKWC